MKYLIYFKDHLNSQFLIEFSDSISDFDFIFEVEIFWFVTPCNIVIGCQRFRGPYCLHFQGEVLS
jgi:hypothetical protein